MKALSDHFAELVDRVRSTPPYTYWHDRAGATRRLFAHKDESVTLIAPVLRDPDAQVRRYFARLVRELDRTRAREMLRPLIVDLDDDVRLEAVRGVLDEAPWRGGPVHPAPLLDTGERESLMLAVRPLLRSGKLYAFTDAIEILEKLGDRELPELVSAMLPAADVNRRWSIFGVLSRASDADERLAPLTRHTDVETRQDACTALGHVRTGLVATGREAILRCLDDANEAVRSAAALAAGRRGVREAEPKLLTLMAGVAERNVIEALSLLGSSSAVPLIRAQAKAAGPQRSDAIRALSRFSLDSETEATLIELLSHDPDPYIMKQAGEALIELGCVRAVPPLEQFVQKFARRLAKRSRKDVLRTFPPAIERLLRSDAPR